MLSYYYYNFPITLIAPYICKVLCTFQRFLFVWSCQQLCEVDWESFLIL
jgi:hypothetical protein